MGRRRTRAPARGGRRGLLIGASVAAIALIASLLILGRGGASADLEALPGTYELRVRIGALEQVQQMVLGADGAFTHQATTGTGWERAGRGSWTRSGDRVKVAATDAKGKAYTAEYRWSAGRLTGQGYALAKVSDATDPEP